jgi:hypothetical protein
MEQTECSETSAYKIQTPGNYPEKNIQHTEHGESLKSRISYLFHSRKNLQTCLFQAYYYRKMHASLERNVFEVIIFFHDTPWWYDYVFLKFNIWQNGECLLCDLKEKRAM